ncbi:MAG: glycosyltransferase [Bacteroidetes bacterium]|nr:glycosyltransferase [Bacteroidota bacterium]
MISIIIPTLQEARLLPQILDQFPAELRAEYELDLIVSDGGSTDDTVAIAKRAGARVVRHEGEHRQTIAEGRNRGAAAAHGDILVFINADIRISNVRHFLVQAKTVLQKPGVVGATAPVQVFPEEEIPADRMFHVWHNGYVRFLNVVGEGMGRGECQVLSTALFRVVGGYNPTMVAGEDYDLFRRVRKHGKIVMLPGVTIYESPRRFRKYGYLHILWGWTRNALAVIFRNSSSSEEWEAVR